MFVELADEGALSFRPAVPAQVVCPDRVPAAGQVRADMAVAAAVFGIAVHDYHGCLGFDLRPPPLLEESPAVTAGEMIGGVFKRRRRLGRR